VIRLADFAGNEHFVNTTLVESVKIHSMQSTGNTAYWEVTIRFTRRADPLVVKLEATDENYERLCNDLFES
jgi:hypothetical protein